MTVSRGLSSSSLYIPRRISADLCLHVATLLVQVSSIASPAIRILLSLPFRHEMHSATDNASRKQ
jgi:hypothetical protein